LIPARVEAEDTMPKMKTHKGIKKRVRVTAKGKIRHKRANSGHLMSGKSGNRCRALRKPGLLKRAFRNHLKHALAGGGA
jgi:large subunit ribosomal protein L35